MVLHIHIHYKNGKRKTYKIDDISHEIKSSLPHSFNIITNKGRKYSIDLNKVGVLYVDI